MQGNVNQTSFRKKQLLNSSIPAFGAKRVFIAHQANEGDTGIDLTNLSMPTELSNKGYVNPTLAEIKSLKLKYFKNNVTIHSKDRGLLMKLSYDIPTWTQINFDGFTANANEIFEINYEPSIIGAANLVEARPYAKTYLLPEGETDVDVEPFEYNKFPEMQIGAVMVFRGPTLSLQLRNVNNATAAPGADGNFQEVAGGGLCEIIRFNVAAGAGGEQVTIVSLGALMERPTESMLAYLEKVNGTQAKIIDAVVAGLGTDPGYFEAVPTSVDLSTFSADVYALKGRFAADGLIMKDSAGTEKKLVIDADTNTIIIEEV